MNACQTTRILSASQLVRPFLYCSSSPKNARQIFLAFVTSGCKSTAPFRLPFSKPRRVPGTHHKATFFLPFFLSSSLRLFAYVHKRDRKMPGKFWNTHRTQTLENQGLSSNEGCRKMPGRIATRPGKNRHPLELGTVKKESKACSSHK